MADLGNLHISYGQFQIKEKLVIRMNVNNIVDEVWLNIPTNKSLSGILKLNGAVAARPVRAYHRASGLPVNLQAIVSGLDGSFTIGGVSADEYYVVGLPTDEDGANAVIVDRVQGV